MCDRAGRPTFASSSLSDQPSESMTIPFVPGQLGGIATSVIPSEETPSTQYPQGNSAAPGSHMTREQEEGGNRNTNTSKISEPLRLSLFSGMELVNRSKPVCLVEPVPVESDAQTSVEATTGIDCASEKSCERTAGSPTSSEQVSAFSFLNLWCQLSFTVVYWHGGRTIPFMFTWFSLWVISSCTESALQWKKFLNGMVFNNLVILRIIMILL